MEYEPKSEEERQALEAGALSWTDRKQQRWGDFFWRPAGPFDWTGCDDVEVMAGKLSGVPTVGPSRFSADNLLFLYEEGMSVREIFDSYMLDLRDIVNVLAFARSHGIASNGSEDVFSIQEQVRRNPEAAKLRTGLVDWTGCSLVTNGNDTHQGRPVLAGTDVLANTVVEDFDEGGSAENIASRYGVSPELVRGALQFAGRLTQVSAAA